MSPSPLRVACLWAPLFPLAARLRSEPELFHEAVAVVAGHGDGARIVAATRLARRAGIRTGTTLAQARATLPKLIARPRDEECERAAQEALLEVAESFSPRVEDGGEGLVFLDASGLDRHHPGESPEEELARALMLASDQRAGLPVRAGVASSKLAARLAAERPHAPHVVPEGEEAEFLAPLPLGQVTLQTRTLSTLKSWGLHSLGDLAGLPEAEVISRLGEAGRELQAIARGEDPRPLVPRQTPLVLEEGMELEWPLVNLEPFLFVARAALERLAIRLAAQALACQRLVLSLALEPEGHHERAITLPAPTREVKTLLTLVRLDLETHPPPAPITSFTLTAHPDRPRRAQLSLFGPEALSPDQVATTLARLFALLGEDRVGSPRPVDAHHPERFALVPFAPPPPPKIRLERRSPQGSLLSVRVLRPPLEVEVRTTHNAPQPSPSADAPAKRATDFAHETSCARPLAIKSLVQEEEAKRLQIDGRVRVASGPWGLEEAWWSAAPQERDYWDVELDGGALYRIFHERQSGDWFVDGIYD